MIVVALAVGFGLSYYALTDGRIVGVLQVGPWTARPAIGSASPDPYSRAYLVRAGGLQLGQSEGIAFTAINDSDGVALDRGCRYRITGTTPVASFWTLVAAARDGSNIARPDGLQGLRSRSISREADGSMILYVSHSLAPDNWLEITGAGSFELILTLYDTTNLSGAGADVSVQALPAIRKEACGA
jgi:hypothetical protein